MGAGHPRMPLEKRVVFHGMPFKEIDEGIHDIGDHKAHEKRQTQTLCHFQKCMYGIADAGQVADDFFKSTVAASTMNTYTAILKYG